MGGHLPNEKRKGGGLKKKRKPKAAKAMAKSVYKKGGSTSMKSVKAPAGFH